MQYVVVHDNAEPAESVKERGGSWLPFSEFRVLGGDTTGFSPHRTTIYQFPDGTVEAHHGDGAVTVLNPPAALARIPLRGAIQNIAATRFNDTNPGDPADPPDWLGGYSTGTALVVTNWAGALTTMEAAVDSVGNLGATAAERAERDATRKLYQKLLAAAPPDEVAPLRARFDANARRRFLISLIDSPNAPSTEYLEIARRQRALEQEADQ